MLTTENVFRLYDWTYSPPVKKPYTINSEMNGTAKGAYFPISKLH